MMRRGSKIIKLVAIIVLLSFAMTMVAPGVAFAKFSLFRGIKKVVGFVVKLPDKLTKPLGPLAPIAQMWLLNKVPKFGRIVKKASEVKRVSDDIERQKRKVVQVRAVYRDQSMTFRERARKLEKKRKKLAGKLTREGLSWAEYKGRVASIQGSIGALNKAARRLDDQAGKLRAEDIVSMFAKRAANTLLANAQGLIVQEIATELDSMVNPVIVSAFLDGDGLKADEILDRVINGDIERLIKDKKLGRRADIGSLRRRIRDRVGSGGKDDIDFLKDNWEEELDAIIEGLIADANKGNPGGAVSDDEETETVETLVFRGRGRFTRKAGMEDGVAKCANKSRMTIHIRPDGEAAFVYDDGLMIAFLGNGEYDCRPAAGASYPGTHDGNGNFTFTFPNDVPGSIRGTYDKKQAKGSGDYTLDDRGSGAEFFFTLTR